MRPFPSEDLLRDGDPGAVDGAVQPLELERGVHGGLHGALVGDVGCDETDVFRESLAFEVRDYHIGT